MKKLLSYDLRENKYRFLFLFLFMIVDCIIFYPSEEELSVPSAWTFILTLIFLFVFGFSNIFTRMFRKRFIKDDLVNYSGISPQEITLEPILICILVSVLAIFELFVSLQILPLGETVLKGNHDTFVVNYLIFLIPTLLLMYTSFTLCLWGFMRSKGVKSANSYEWGELFGVLLCLLIVFAVNSSQLSKALALPLITGVAILLFLLHYVMQHRRIYN